MTRAKREGFLIGLALLGCVLLAYGPVFENGFVNLDDNAYLTEGSLVKDGLTARGAAWAFTTTHAGNWHPLAWLSHMADVELFGMNPRGHHGVSLLLHAANAALLFLGLRALTGAAGASAAVAALFALHPLHVEAVAWTAERKELLCTFFWLLSAGAYLRYARRPGPRRYAPVFVFLALALLAKPMAVTAPFLFLLLDFWPLGRLGPSPCRFSPGRAARLLAEKLPLVALSAAASAVTYLVQRGSGAMRSVDVLPMGERAANAAVAAATYAIRTVVPRGLAVFYPHPEGGLPAWKVLGAVLALAAVTAVVAARARRAPYLAFGWAWFLGTLVPVIGLVQVGGQAMADRYTYVPLTGLFVGVAWGVREAAQRRAAPRRLVVPATALLLAACVALTRRQSGYWRDDFTLYERALSVAPPSWLVLNNLGTAYFDRGDMRGAEREYRRALEILPESPEGLVNLGISLARQGRVPEALGFFQAAVREDPTYPKGRLNYGLALAWRGSGAEAVAELWEAVRLGPGYADGLLALGVALELSGRAAEASPLLREAYLLDPRLTARRGEYEAILRRPFRNSSAVPSPP